MSKMADSGQKAEKQLGEITECPICMSVFTDPRMLPCIHTFCFECLKSTSEAMQKKPGDKMPCPLCRKDFVIPEDGVNGVQKNFFMQNLLEFKTTLQMGSATITCDMCDAINEDREGKIPTATMRCLQCQENYCPSCVKVHKFQKFNKDHQIVAIGSCAKSEMKRGFAIKFCSNHGQKPLDYYCADCKRIVCVSCFVESHASHKCKDVSTVDEEFRKTIERKASKISIYMNESFYMINYKKERKAEFLKQMIEKEAEIHKQQQELIDNIERHAQSLLEELSVIKSNHLKEMETEMEDIERCRAIIGSFEVYCTELILKGSASDICSSVDQIIGRAEELEKDHEAYIGHPHKSVEVSFQATNLNNASTNLVGYVKGKIVICSLRVLKFFDELSYARIKTFDLH